MKTRIAKVVGAAMLSAAIAFSVLPCNICNAFSQQELLAQVEEVKRQILVLQIQLIQTKIYDLQIQLAQLQLSPAFVDVIWPAGGEKLENRHYYYILWEARGVENVSIELKTPGSTRVIAENVPAAEGRWYWNTGSIAGDSYRIRIFDAANPKIAGETAKAFTIFDNSLKNKCVDGTVAGQCSADKPKLCFDVEIGLVDACKSCGCPSGQYCGTDSKCR
ncbi:MAG: hypothetical protein WA103_00645 [Minisyncoccales bacterium]